jgi:hypothetical protein
MPRKPPSRKIMTRAFRKRMLKQAALFLGGLALALTVLAFTLGSKYFAIAALILIPVSAITFNIMQRRAYTASIAGKQ